MNKLDIKGDTKKIVELFEFIETKDSKFDFNKIIPLPVEEEENWYHWRVNNWGTKWFPDNVEKSIETNYAEISFWTAWSPPSGIINALSEKFPELRFILWYEECGMDFSGYQIWENGVCVDEDEDEFNTYWTSYDEDGNINEEYNFPDV
jgi:hypothetical protein